MPLLLNFAIGSYFATVDDPRKERTRDHALLDIIVIALAAIICGAASWVAVAEFGRLKQVWLHPFLDLPNGIPSHDTFGRVFARIDPAQFQHSFVTWVQAIQEIHGDVIAIDGKTHRRSHDQANGTGHVQSRDSGQLYPTATPRPRTGRVPSGRGGRRCGRGEGGLCTCPGQWHRRLASRKAPRGYPGPARTAWCSVRSPWTAHPTKSPPFPCSWICSICAIAQSRSMPWAVKPRLRPRLWRAVAPICSP